MFSTFFKPSLRFLRSHPALIGLMVITLATWALAIVSIPFIWDNLPTPHMSIIRLLTMYYICYLFCVFSFVFFQSIFVQIVAAHLENQPPATWHYIVQSCKKLPQLFIWSLLHAHLYFLFCHIYANLMYKPFTYIPYLITFKSMSAYQAGQEIFSTPHRQSIKAVSFGRRLMLIYILTYALFLRLMTHFYPALLDVLYSLWTIVTPGLIIGAFSIFLSSIVNTAVYLCVFEKINTSYFSEEALKSLTPHEEKTPF